MSRAETQGTSQTGMTLGSVIVQSARLHADAEAIVMSGIRWSYAQLLKRALAVASALRSAGLERGDRMGLLMENGPEYVELLLGAALLGVVPVLLGDKTRGDELGMRLPSLGLKAVFVSSSERFDFAEVIQEAWEVEARETGRANEPSRMRLWRLGPATDDDYPTYDDFLAGSADASASILDQLDTMQPTDPFAIVFTSGLTGIPKTCRLNHLTVLGKAAPFAQRFGLTAQSRLWMPTPMFQIGFLQPLIASLAVGACVVAMRRFDPLAALHLLRSERVTHVYPIYLSYWLPIIHQLEFRPSNFAALSYMVLLGPLSMLRRVQRVLPQCVVMNTYGSAEEGGAFCLPRASDPAEVRLGAVGRPYPGHEVRIVNPANGAVCSDNELGEIQVRGCAIPRPEEQDEFGSKFTADGWLRTSDLGSLSEAGVLLRFHGRLAELLTIGKTNVSAMTIESALSEHPAVAVAQVIAVADDVLGMVAAAFVELRPGDSLKAPELVEFCRTRLEADVVPRYIQFVSEWPTTASKIHKPLLAERGLGPRLIK